MRKQRGQPGGRTAAGLREKSVECRGEGSWMMGGRVRVPSREARVRPSNKVVALPGNREAG